ncbi:ATP-grasp domain-containing protein [Burkholderia stabilis]|uniref:ATP-grasp domain-containing protein n=1 Tax=Burkholderia stabilis TaxID=95485 RepID=UPI001F4AD313|nr:ATP-grasp domain-containing protein [Burkholderia stabilis]
MTQAPAMLYLDTRALAGERIAEIDAARSLGLDLYVATPTPDAFRSFGCAGIIPTRLGDYDAAERTILDYLREHRVELSGVVAWKDLEVVLASRLSQRLGLRGTAPDAALNVRDKAATRRVLDAVPNANPRYAVVGSEAEFTAALKRIGTPALLKPAGNSGSRGIFPVGAHDDPAEVYRAFRAYNSPEKGEMFSLYGDHALLEEQLTGSEHSVSGVVAHGRVAINAIIDKTFDRSIPIQYENVTPSLLPADTQAAIRDMVRAGVAATGIDWCGFHADVMVTRDGPKILEIGGRLGGEFINSHLIPYSVAGFSPYRTVLDLARGAIDGPLDDRLGTASTRAGQRIVMPPGIGRIARVEGLERLWRRPELRFLQIVAGKGAQMALPKDVFKAYEIAYLIAQCELDRDIAALLRDLAADVTVTLD